MDAARFWRVKRLEALSQEEWESLCDGCGKCCMVRLRDDTTDDVVDTNIACRLFEANACRCLDYKNRFARVSDCVRLTPTTVREIDWLPRTCAYRLVAEGADLPWWHHLISGSRSTVHEAGMSVRGRTVPELEVAEKDVEDHVVVWPGEDDA